MIRLIDAATVLLFLTAFAGCQELAKFSGGAKPAAQTENDVVSAKQEAPKAVDKQVYPELDALCSKRVDCEVIGACHFVASPSAAAAALEANVVQEGECKARSQLQCMRSKACDVMAFCTYDAESSTCVIGRGDCRKSKFCKVHGRCSEGRRSVGSQLVADINGMICVAAIAEDCRAAALLAKSAAYHKRIEINDGACVGYHEQTGEELNLNSFLRVRSF
jgi:hypothetical protein